MKWFKQILSVLTAMNMILAPTFVLAQTTPQGNIAREEAYRKMAEESGHVFEVEKDAQGVPVKGIFKDKEGNQVLEIPFQDAPTLRKWSPKRLNESLVQQMVKLKTASAASFAHSLKSLPAESAIFFMAMGAVVAGQLITNYSANPTGMQQHLEHQMSPIGTIGFFTFMYSQGVTSNMLSMYIKNPKFGIFIPYLGMAVGAFAQTYISELIADPNVRTCAKTWMGGKVTEADLKAGADVDPCDKAYEYLVIHRKIWEAAPGLVSMLTSSLIAGLVEKGASKLAMRWVGVEIATLLVPGGAEVKAIRLLLTKGVQIGLFIAIDSWLSTRVNYVWKNIFDGLAFKQMSIDLANNIYMQKSKSWATDNKDFVKLLKEFHTKSSEWRMMNLNEVYSAHGSWSAMLHQLTGQYNATESYYSSFLEKVRASRAKVPNNPLDIAYPLNGVKAKGMTEDRLALYFTHPKNVEPMQGETVDEVVAYINNALTTKAYDAQSFQPRMLAKLKEISTLMADKDFMKKGEGILLLNKTRYDETVSSHGYGPYNIELYKIYQMLGAPEPLMTKGRGFGATYEAVPETKDALKGVAFMNAVGSFATPRITDYFTMQMLCGPDAEKGDSIVSTTAGFPAWFRPPQLKNPDHVVNGCNYPGKTISSEYIYNFETDVQGTKYPGLFDYLKSNIRPWILGRESVHFKSWWTRNTEKQMQEAFTTFGESYDEIIVKLVNGIFDTKIASSNQGPMANGTIASIYQEARVYQTVLSELLKDTYKAQRKQDLPSSYFSPKIYVAPLITNPATFPKNIPRNAKVLPPTYVPFLQSLSQSLAVNFDSAKTYRVLQAQINIEGEMNVLYNLLKKIKTSTVAKSDTLWNKTISLVGMGRRNVVVSDLENSELEEQINKIQASLTGFADLLGVGEKKAGAVVTLTPDQSELAVLAIQNIQTIATEMMMYGSMANAVSWNKIQNTKSLNLKQQQFQNEACQKLLKMSSMLKAAQDYTGPQQ